MEKLKEHMEKAKKLTHKQLLAAYEAQLVMSMQKTALIEKLSADRESNRK